MFVNFLSFVKNKYQTLLNKFKSKKTNKIKSLLHENEILKNFILNSIPIITQTFNHINQELNKNAELNKDICKMFNQIDIRLVNYQEIINQHAEIINELLMKRDNDISNIYPTFSKNVNNKN